MKDNVGFDTGGLSDKHVFAIAFSGR